MSIISPSNIANINLPNQLAATDRRLGPITYIASNELSFYKNNPRKHPEKQIVKLMASIREFGIALPILVDVNHVIIAGAAVVEAARRLDIAQLPTIVADQWNTQQVKSYRLASNRLAELSNWDNESLAIELSAIIEFDEVAPDILGWENHDVEFILDLHEKIEIEVDPADAIPAISTPDITRIGDMWQLGEHRLLCDSNLASEAWTKLMDGKVAKMAFTSVPYNASAAGCACGDTKCEMADEGVSSIKRQQSLTDVVARITKSLADGAILGFCIEWTMIEECLRAFGINGLPLTDMCVWNKNRDEVGNLYRSKHELVLITKIGNAPHINNIHLNKSRSHRTNVWDYAVSDAAGRSSDGGLSPYAAKPIALVTDAICDFTLADEIVVDGFVGRGTTILAAERAGRLCFGMEVDPSEVDIAIRRWEAMTGERAILAGTGETYSEVAARRATECEAPQDS